MKNFTKLFLSLIFVCIVSQSCQNNSLKNDKLAISLSNLNNYLKEMNNNSKGAFFEYIEKNPNYTIEEIEQKGFIDKSIVLKEIEVIDVEVNKREGEEVWEIAKKVVDPEFLSSDDTPALRICLFCCTGCLDRIKRNHCITVIVWEMGPGC